MKTRSILTGFLLAALLLATLAAHLRFRRLREDEWKEDRKVLAGALSPAEMASATLLGGFRSIAIDIIWIRLFRYREEQHFDELPGLYSALEVLQGNSPGLYHVQANQMIFDLPHLLPHRPEERAMWIRRGLEVLERGLRRFPNDLLLLREGAAIYYLRFDSHRFPGDRAWFLNEPSRPGDPVPFGRDPALRALELGTRALKDPKHDFYVDVVLLNCYNLLLEEKSISLQMYLSGTSRLLDHMEQDHRDAPELKKNLPIWRKHLEMLRQGGALRPPPEK